MVETRVSQPIFAEIPLHQLPEGSTLVPWGPYSTYESEEAVRIGSKPDAEEVFCYPEATVKIDPMTLRQYTGEVFSINGALQGTKHFTNNLLFAINDLMPYNEFALEIGMGTTAQTSARIAEGAVIFATTTIAVTFIPGLGQVVMIAGLLMGGGMLALGYLKTQSQELALQKSGIQLGQEGLVTLAFAGGMIASVKTSARLAELQTLQRFHGTRLFDTLVKTPVALCALDDPLHAKNILQAFYNQSLIGPQ